MQSCDYFSGGDEQEDTHQHQGQYGFTDELMNLKSIGGTCFIIDTINFTISFVGVTADRKITNGAKGHTSREPKLEATQADGNSALLRLEQAVARDLMAKMDTETDGSIKGGRRKNITSSHVTGATSYISFGAWRGINEMTADIPLPTITVTIGMIIVAHLTTYITFNVHAELLTDRHNLGSKMEKPGEAAKKATGHGRGQLAVNLGRTRMRRGDASVPR